MSTVELYTIDSTYLQEIPLHLPLTIYCLKSIDNIHSESALLHRMDYYESP